MAICGTEAKIMLLVVTLISFLIGFAFGRLWEILDDTIILADPIDGRATQGETDGQMQQSRGAPAESL
jgi:hypothetical protein